MMAVAKDTERGEINLQQEGREPLIQAKETTIYGKGDGDYGSKESSRGHPWMVYLSTFVAVCGSYEFGACAGYSSPTQSAIIEELGLSIAEYSLFGSILTFGAMIGAITSGAIADFIGRKGVPVYIAEIAPFNLRGALTTLNQLMICTGVSVAFILGIVLHWRVLALTGLVPCAILLLGLSFIPESPRWLAKRGAEIEFELALQKLRGAKADISSEATEIQDYVKELEHLPTANMLDLFQRRYLRSVVIGGGLMVFQQFGGINGICFFVSSIFESAGFSSTIGTITYALLQVVITALGASLIDKAGRKPLLLARETSSEVAAILAVSGLLVYIASFSAGMGAVPWVVMSEIFPINVKGAAGSLATLVNWFGAWACSYTFNFLMDWSSYGTFILYAAVNALAFLFVVKVVPETKEKTLEQIQATINA